MNTSDLLKKLKECIYNATDSLAEERNITTAFELGRAQSMVDFLLIAIEEGDISND